MKVIERYIFRRVLVVFVAALAWSLAIVWTTQVLAKIDIVTDTGQTALTFFEIATLVLPTVIPLVIPFALIIGIAQTLTTMNTDSELAVIAASGASRSVVVRPIVLLGLLASIGSFVVDNAVEPFARVRNRELIAESRGDLLSLVIQEGQFRRLESGLYMQVGQRLPNGNLGQIFVADYRDKSVELIYYAKSGSVVKVNGANQLLMFDGEVNRKTPSGDISVIRFASYAFDLGSFQAASKDILLLPKDRTLPYLLNPSPDDKLYQSSPMRYIAELHRRLTEWTMPLVFSLIALAVAGDAKSHRQARVHPLITTATIALFCWWLSYLVGDQAEKRPELVYAMYALPAAWSALCVWLIATNRTLDPPIAAVDWVMERFGGLAAWARALWPGNNKAGRAACWGRRSTCISCAATWRPRSGS